MGDQRGPIRGQIMVGRGKQRLLVEFTGTVAPDRREAFLAQLKQVAEDNNLQLRKFDAQELEGESWGPLVEGGGEGGGDTP